MKFLNMTTGNIIESKNEFMDNIYLRQPSKYKVVKEQNINAEAQNIENEMIESETIKKTRGRLKKHTDQINIT
ncbi:MAG: hypothetical protein FWD71_21685 [Oscillospiraceae bacterium]|nr:hypothetical protein [Oscillospiraceae bacterium]